ncbi:MAG: YhcN/YlaJ family sporulation lipoprotein [Defluviitaleaceae bacterium]|nr:YhcN/YlaJ family sporulation lipoprotein [Defluviitaleaceae bacterium]
MRDFFVILALILLGASACGSADGGSDGYIQEYETKAEQSELSEKDLSEYLNSYEEVANTSIHIYGNSIIIGLDLVADMETKDLTRLKDAIKSDIKAKNSHINHVAITTSPDLYKKILGISENSSPPQPPEAEIFEIPVPTF